MLRPYSVTKLNGYYWKRFVSVCFTSCIHLKIWIRKTNRPSIFIHFDLIAIKLQFSYERKPPITLRNIFQIKKRNYNFEVRILEPIFCDIHSNSFRDVKWLSPGKFQGMTSCTNAMQQLFATSVISWVQNALKNTRYLYGKHEFSSLIAILLSRA